MRLLAYVILPNHGHLVVWPQHNGDLSTYAQWLTVTHVRRWHTTGVPWLHEWPLPTAGFGWRDQPGAPEEAPYPAMR
jgi:hypothetical protein